VMSRGK